MRTIRNIKNLKDKRVLLRVDFDVPVQGSKVSGEGLMRIQAALPTIQYLQKKGAKIILLTHLGRPKGKRVAALSAKPLVRVLEKLLKTKVGWDKEGLRQAQALTILENLRFHPGEEKNDPKFAKILAELGDVYVNDAFANSHRKHASMAGITKYLPSYAGLRLEAELKNLQPLVSNIKHPFVVIIGGIKIKTKLPVIKKLLQHADYMLVGGAIAKALLTKSPIAWNKKIIIPEDGKGKKRRGLAQDIGPKTIKSYLSYIRLAKTIVWNGPMGVCEEPRFAKGTIALAKALAAQARKGAFVVVGGGNTIACAAELLPKKNCWISTGGGAMLEYLAGKKLPGLQTLSPKS